MSLLCLFLSTHIRRLFFVVISSAFFTFTAGAASLALPAPVPYLNPPDRPKQQQYFVGNGMAGALASPDGTWSQIMGPGYGAKRLTINERLSLEVDGTVHPLTFAMHRARTTGIYYATAAVGDLSVELIDHARLVDHARLGDWWLSRSLRITNHARATRHIVSVHVQLANAEAALVDRAGRPAGYRQGPVAIAFTAPGATASATGNHLQSAPVALDPGASISLGLIHDATGALDVDVVEKIRALDDRALAAQAIADWQQWFEDVPPAYRLELITDSRARDLVEGALVTIKANQSGDGGFMASAAVYNQGYVRDAVMGLRGLNAAGHFREAKRWLEWASLQFIGSKAVANWWSLAPFPGMVYGGGVGRWDFETTSLVVLTMRDYHRATGDRATLVKAQRMLNYCIDIQAKYAEVHDDTLLFHGDETEICLAIPADRTGIGLRGEGASSYPSAALFTAALDFYADYLRATGTDPRQHINAITKQNLDVLALRDRMLATSEKSFWRTDLPAVPNGFHDSFRRIDSGAWPAYPIVNFTLQPIYWGSPFAIADRKRLDVEAVKTWFNRDTGRLQLFPGLDNGFCGHTLGYFLWALLEVKDPLSEDVYRALTQGPTVSWLGYWNEAYNANGVPYTDYAPKDDNGLRTMETGVNLSAIARYWHLGEGSP